jgi:hypothetical protein
MSRRHTISNRHKARLRKERLAVIKWHEPLVHFREMLECMRCNLPEPPIPDIIRSVAISPRLRTKRRQQTARRVAKACHPWRRSGGHDGFIPSRRAVAARLES